MTIESADLPRIAVDRGETREAIVHGAVRAMSLIKKVVAGRKVEGQRWTWNHKLVMRIHDLIYYADPNANGNMLRQTDATRVSGKPVGRAGELPHKFYLFGRWLEEQMEFLRENPEDIISALAVAEDHYIRTLRKIDETRALPPDDVHCGAMGGKCRGDAPPRP